MYKCPADLENNSNSPVSTQLNMYHMKQRVPATTHNTANLMLRPRNIGENGVSWSIHLLQRGTGSNSFATYRQYLIRSTELS